MPRMLVIDDNPQDRLLAARALLAEFTDVSVAEIADRETLDTAIAAGGYDAVLTDYRLRWANGLDVVDAVRRAFPDIPVVMFTNTGNEEVAAEGFRRGLADYILKGIGQYVVAARAVRRALDMAALKRREQELLEREQNARIRAEDASRAKDDFLATISHELRTPLSAISGWVQILEKDPGQAARGLEAIGRNAHLLTRLVDDLVDLSRVVTGRLSLATRPVDLRDVLAAATDIVRPAMDAKRVELSIDAPDHLSSITGDPDRLQQVVWNLLSNAVKFTPAGGRITARIAASNGSQSLTIADTGKGITAEFLPHVFDRFSQQETGPTRSRSGMGLGLAIVRHLVELHGGTVSADSAGPGTGATFSITLPTA